MNKRVAIPLLFAILLGVFTSAIGAAVWPGMLRVTGPILCEHGTHFVVHEGPEETLQDNRRVAPVHFACVDPRGVETGPNIAAAVFLIFLVETLVWWALLSWMVRRLMAGAERT